MNLPSSEQRLWAFDTTDQRHPTLILRDRVMHGAGSDPDQNGFPVRFGNTPDSGMTSLGLYRIAESFVGEQGKPGFALDGLDDGFNNEARFRHVVFHPSTYVSEAGSVGLSLGCPAVNPATFQRLAKFGMEGALLWIDGPDPTLVHAPSLSCADGLPAPELRVCRLPSSTVWNPQILTRTSTNSEHATWHS